MADDPNHVQIPVKRHDVNLTLEDLMTPLTAFPEKTQGAEGAAAAPEVHEHASALAGLARQILDVSRRLNAVAPHLLAPGDSDARPGGEAGPNRKIP